MQTIYPSSDVHAWATRIYGPNKRLLITDYVLPCDFGTVVKSTSATKQVQIQANADFVLSRIGFAFNTAFAGNIYDIRAQLTDSATGEQFGNSEIQILNFADSETVNGQAMTFNSLPYPRWIGGNTSISAYLKNNDSTNDIGKCILSLHGFLIREY